MKSSLKVLDVDKCVTGESSNLKTSADCSTFDSIQMFSDSVCSGSV